MKRKLDKLNRICIPIKFFNVLGLSQNQEMEIIFEYGQISIKKFKRENIQERSYIGIIRRLDNLHRLVIPTEYLSLQGITPGEMITVTMENEKIKIMH